MSGTYKMVGDLTAAAPFGAHLGLEAVKLADDLAVFRMPFKPQNVTIGEMVHGGAIAGLIDATATAAAWCTTKLPPNARGTTIGFSVNYLAPALGADLTAKASVIQRGSSIVIIEVLVSDVRERAIAKATVTYKLSGKAA